MGTYRDIAVDSLLKLLGLPAVDRPAVEDCLDKVACAVVEIAEAQQGKPTVVPDAPAEEIVPANDEPDSPPEVTAPAQPETAPELPADTDAPPADAPPATTDAPAQS
jgi:hypothetical protein